MLNKFLKRFEKLENNAKDSLFIQRARVSRRFERLEIGNNKIEVEITDKVIPEEQAPAEIKYKIVCPYCGMENANDAELCSFCKHELKTELSKDYQDKAHLIRVCGNCHAKNLSDRVNCWVCGKNLSSGSVKQIENTGNIISLNVDGRVYKSTDQDLPFEIALLMAKIRNEGYRKEVIDQWLQERNNKIESEKNNLETQIVEVQYGLIWRIVGLVAFIIFLIFQFRACARTGI